MTTKREITYSQAIREAIDQSMEKDRSVIVIGEGVPDPKGIFGTTLGLSEKYGKARVFDMPVSENGVTGICIGAALTGLRPIMTHQRIDFSLLSYDQIVNTAAKWFFIFGGQICVPLVIRMIIGRGWGQGAQHSQSLQALYAHIPGLKVVMPTTPYDVKGLLIEAIYDNNPVIFIEHRWLYNIKGDVPKGFYKVKIGKGKVLRSGRVLTLVASSFMTIEALRAVNFLQREGIDVELIDARSIKPFDEQLILRSVEKTGRLVVADTGWKTSGFAAEVIATVTEKAFRYLRSQPGRVTLPDIPTPTSWKLAEKYYPTYKDIIKKVLKVLDVDDKKILEKLKEKKKIPSDVPDNNFRGPF